MLLAVSVLGQVARKVDPTPVITLDLLNTLGRFMAASATCERISRTPIPLPYSRCVLTRPMLAHPQTALQIPSGGQFAM